MATEDEEIAALNNGIGRAAAVKREARTLEYMRQINAKLDRIEEYIAARTGAKPEQTKKGN